MLCSCGMYGLHVTMAPASRKRGALSAPLPLRNHIEVVDTTNNLSLIIKSPHLPGNGLGGYLRAAC